MYESFGFVTYHYQKFFWICHFCTFNNIFSNPCTLPDYIGSDVSLFFLLNINFQLLIKSKSKVFDDVEKNHRYGPNE